MSVNENILNSNKASGWGCGGVGLCYGYPLPSGKIVKNGTLFPVISGIL